jgi:Family of unknown function (DUF6152)
MRSKALVYLALGALTALCTAGVGVRAAWAHHSFAVFFDAQKSVTLSGVVEEFQFVNPHGLIRMTVKKEGAEPEEWKIETNSPSILRRRGWAPDSIKKGDVITVEGWPARDNSHWARLRKAQRANGEPIGKPFEPEA